MPTELFLAGVMMAALVLYALFAGADFGGGLWDLAASGPRKAEQRALIEKAIGPIWEANHVWLILAVVLLFAGFPAAYAAISIALHIPITLFLIGVVFRGSAFTFRAYDSRGDKVQRRWGLIFSLASVSSPIVLGMVVGAIASGDVRFQNGVFEGSFFTPWLAPFPFVVGLFALALFAYLAAVYLAHEAEVGAGSPELADDFRRRALLAGAAVGVCALAAFALSFEAAPHIRKGLTHRSWTWPLHAMTALAALAGFWTLRTRRLSLARFAVGAQTALILLGWAASQYPFLVVPDVTLAGAAANERTRHLLLIALAAGSALLFPSLFVLYRVFKGKGGFRVGAPAQR
jgi:cytochrome bd ubiquinol oxidase subunit II